VRRAVAKAEPRIPQAGTDYARQLRRINIERGAGRAGGAWSLARLAIPLVVFRNGRPLSGIVVAKPRHGRFVIVCGAGSPLGVPVTELLG